MNTFTKSLPFAISLLLTGCAGAFKAPSPEWVTVVTTADWDFRVALNEITDDYPEREVRVLGVAKGEDPDIAWIRTTELIDCQNMTRRIRSQTASFRVSWGYHTRPAPARRGTTELQPGSIARMLADFQCLNNEERIRSLSELPIEIGATSETPF